MKTIIKLLTLTAITISFSSCQTTHSKNDNIIPLIHKGNTPKGSIPMIVC